MIKRILLIAICWCCWIGAKADEYMIQHWGVEDGLSQNTVMCMLQDKQGFMWFGTWDGLNRFDGYTFQVYKPANGQLINTRIDLLYEDESETLWWMTYDEQFFSMDKNRSQQNCHSIEEIPDAMRQQIAHRNDTLRVDKHGVIWVADTKPGILRYRDGQWKRFLPKQDIRFKGQARRNMIFLEDQNGRVWINPTGGGFGYYDYEKDKFVCPLRSTSTIHTAYIDREGLLWVSTFDKGIDCLNFDPQPYAVHDQSVWQQKNGEVRAMYVSPTGEVQMVEKDERMVYCLTESPYGLLYGTRGNGLQLANGKNLPIQTENPDVYDLACNGNRIYAATFGSGINIFEQGERTIIGNGLKTRCLAVVGDTIWGGTTEGLLCYYNGQEKFIKANDIRSLHYDGKNLYLGTFGAGLLKLEEDSLIRINTSEDIVIAMAGAGDYLWMCSEEGITQLNLTTGQHLYYRALDKTRKAYFSEAKAIVRPDSVICFGYSQGYVEFYPQKAKPLESEVPLRILSCILDDPNKPVETNDVIRMKSGRGAFIVNYAALEYDNPDQIEYSYRLDGVDNDWQYVGNKRFASYMGLKQGKYTLHIRSTNRQGEWMNNEQVVRFIVERSLWTTWWMIVLYVLFIGAIAFVVGLLTRQYTELQQKLLMESEVTNIKLQFFTNISHELRTPLTLISGPIGNILKTEKLSPSLRSQLEIVESNAQRMLRMVNQILDFRKIQNKKLRLRIQKVHLFDIINHTIANFNKEAEDRNIRLQIIQKTDKDLIWVDREKVDTILYNLLSNAFKFTENGKSISVVLDEKPDYVLMSVKDEGVGIPKDKRANLFERFANSTQSMNGNPGTGIGLNLVKDLVDLHHGFIEVESHENEGTTFTVMFKTGNEHFGSEVELIVDDQITAPEKETSALDGIEKQAETRNTKQVMVVDDNEDMRAFLVTILGTEYDVVTARDGADALQKIRMDLPDLIISDLMMPNMGGLELTQRLKQQEPTRYIPIILLTAKSAIESRLEAMEFGADDYVTKPFEPEYLRARVRNILRQREILEQSYREHLRNLDPQKGSEESQPTDSFLAKLLSIMEKQMDNNELTVDELVEQMGMGRTVFFNKLKSITGLSPVEFIREIRIKRAAQLLESGKYNISEVTYMVGMNDSRYFAKCFKSTYGVTPSEFKKNSEK